MGKWSNVPKTSKGLKDLKSSELKVGQESVDSVVLFYVKAKKLLWMDALPRHPTATKLMPPGCQRRASQAIKFYEQEHFKVTSVAPACPASAPTFEKNISCRR